MSSKTVEKKGRIHQILDELRDVAPEEQGRRLLSVIGNIDLSKGRPAKRIATADVLLTYTVALCREQGGRYLGLTLPLPAKEQATVNSFLHVLSQLEAIYHMSFRDLTDRSRAREKDDKEYVGRSLIGRTMCAHEVLLMCAAGHMTWPGKIWASLHLSYRHAAKLGLAHYRRSEDTSEASVVELYAMALVIGLSDPFKMPNRGIYVTQDLIFRNRGSISVEEYGPSAKERSLFLLKLQDDTPAVPLHNVDINNMKGNRLVVDVTALVDVLKQLGETTDTLANRSKNEREAESILEHREVYLHLVRTLGVRPTRGTDRVPDHTKYNMLVGFDAIHTFFASTTGSDFSEEVSLTGETEPIVTPLPSEPIMASGIDISPTGVKVSVTAATSTNLRAGEIVAIWPLGTDDAPIVGFVRWSKAVSAGVLETGIEFLPGIPFAGTLSMLDSDGLDFAVLDCVVLTNDTENLAKGEIIAPGDFDELKKLRQLWANDVTRVVTNAKPIAGHQKLSCFSAQFEKVGVSSITGQS